MCSCQEKKVKLFENLSEHFKRTEYFGKAVFYLYETATVAIMMDNISKASECLYKANILLKKMNNTESTIFSNVKDDLILEIPFIYIVAMRISAQINYFREELKSALHDVKTVANMLGRSYPKFYRNVTEKFVKKVFMNSKESEILEECKCLTIAIEIYLKKKYYSLAFDIARLQNLLLKKIDAYYFENV